IVPVIAIVSATWRSVLRLLEPDEEAVGDVEEKRTAAGQQGRQATVPAHGCGQARPTGDGPGARLIDRSQPDTRGPRIRKRPGHGNVGRPASGRPTVRRASVLDD